MNAIRTTYKGISFRSRLEARWAAWFELMGFEWAYEPLYLDGYIPDFILTGKWPILVEIKPGLIAEDFVDAKNKIERSGWDGLAIVLGATGFGTDFDNCWLSKRHNIGTMRGGWRDDNGKKWVMMDWGDFYVGHCDCGPTLISYDELWCCHRCTEGGKHTISNKDEVIQQAWAQACNVTQWKGARS